MTSIPTMSDGTQPRQWGITNQTLIVSASAKRVLAVLNGREPLVLPPGSVLHLGDPLGALVVTKVSVMASTTRRSGRGTCGRCRASQCGGVPCAPVTADALTRCRRLAHSPPAPHQVRALSYWAALRE